MGTSEDFGGNHMLSWGTEEGGGGFNRPPQNIKGGLWKADYPWRGWGSLEHYRALWGDQVKFIVTQTNPPKRLPSQTINDLSLTSANEEYLFSVQAPYHVKTESKPFCCCSSGVSMYARRSFLLDPDTDRFYACMYTSESWVSIPQVFFVISLELLIVTFQLGFHIAYNNWPIWDSQNAIELENRNRSAVLFLTVQTAENFTYPTNLS